jgi:hypothetical protein
MLPTERERVTTIEAPAPPYPKALRLFPTVRQSLLSSFDACSLSTKFDFQYRHGWSYSYQARGELFHRFASKALATMAMQREDSIPVDAALEILYEVLRQDDVDRECPHCGSTHIRKGATKRGMRFCLHCRRRFETNFIRVPADMVAELYWVVKKWAHDNAFDVDNLVDVEQRLSAKVRYPDGHGGWVERIITGQLDALLIEGTYDDHGIVLDWKDMWKLPPQTEVGHGGYFQQRFYAYLIFANYPTVKTVTLREFYVRYSEPREATLHKELDAPEIEREISALLEQFDRCVEESLWVPSPGAHCTYCPMPQKCPIHPEARGSGRITSPEEAAQTAAEFVVASAIVKQKREQLGPWVEMNGPVPVRDAKGRRVVGYQEYETTIKPSLEEIANAEALKGSPLTQQEIARLHRKRTGTKLTTFVPRPKGDEEPDDADLIQKLQASVRAAEEDRAA